jgi:hypothetical protein
MLTIALLLAVTADPDENFYRSTKQGDWVEWAGGDVVMRHTILSKKDNTLTLRIEQTIGGKKGKPIDQEIDLTKPWPPPRKPDPDVKTVTEELGKGKETLTIGGKKYECEWVKRKTTISIKDQKDFVSVSKVWTCKDVPLGGTVKTESEVDGKTHTTELTGFERGK